MEYTAETFMQEADPIAELFHSLDERIYWIYEGHRDQRISPDVYTEENKPRTERYWGLDLTEIPGRRLWNNVEEIKQHIIYYIINQAVKNRQELMNFFRGGIDEKQDNIDKSFENLTNGWRDEYCLNHPLDQDYDHRMKTAEWRIIQAYYAVFKSVCAMMHTKKKQLSGGHDDRLNVFANEFMDSSARVLFTYPFNFYPESEKGDLHFDQDFLYPYSVNLPKGHELYDESVAELKDNINSEICSGLNQLFRDTQNIVNWESNVDDYTFYHSLMLCREWANYQGGGILCRLHGSGHKKAIDAGLRISAFTALAISEVAVICAYGYETFEKNHKKYVSSCEEAIDDSSDLINQRVDVYRQALSGF